MLPNSVDNAYIQVHTACCNPKRHKLLSCFEFVVREPADVPVCMPDNSIAQESAKTFTRYQIEDDGNISSFGKCTNAVHFHKAI